MTTCINVKSLRKDGQYNNLREWMENKDNLYVGRNGRVSIKGEGTFVYKKSKWCNPYKVEDGNINKALVLYVNHLFDTGLIKDIYELQGYNLGCWCDIQRDDNGNALCHASILDDLRNKCFKYISSIQNNNNNNNTKIAIIGSRTFTDNKLLDTKLTEYFTNNGYPSVIVSGGAIGVDKMSEKYADKYNIKKLIFLPEYNKYGQNAPLVRNKLIVDNSDIIIAFPNKDSKGTWHSINYAKSKHKIVIIFNV